MAYTREFGGILHLVPDFEVDKEIESVIQELSGTLSKQDVKLLPIQRNLFGSFKYVFIDQQSLFCLQIFGSYTRGNMLKSGDVKVAEANNGQSLYGYLNNCVTSHGSRLLFRWLRCPLKDEKEVLTRLNTVEFLSKPANRGLLQTIRDTLKRIGDIPRILFKMKISAASPNEWRTFLKSLHAMKELTNLCLPHAVLAAVAEEDKQRLSAENTPRLLIPRLLDKVVQTIDMGSTSRQKRFVVRQGKHDWLDEWKQVYRCLPDILSRFAEHELDKLRGYIDACGLIYFPLVGFLLQIPSAQVVEELTELGLQFIFSNGDIVYYRTEITQELDRRYGDVMYAILDAETSIMHEVQDEILKCTKPLLDGHAFATRLDCLCALAVAAIQMNGTKPQFTSQNAIRIKNGRHALYEATSPGYRSNSFASSEDKKHITLVSGPNTSGKTMYLKEVGLIVYLAHIGSFVPADFASLPQMDAILAWLPADFGADAGSSKFASTISWLTMALKQGTPRSLLLLDEFPYLNDKITRKATSLGLLDYLAGRDSPHTVLTTLSGGWAVKFLQPMSGKVNFKKMLVSMHEGEPAFLYEIATGVSLQNYGLKIAKTAGIPTDIVAKAYMRGDKRNEEANSDRRRRVLTRWMKTDRNNGIKELIKECLEI
ncbi:MutS protein msh5 [Sparganum proliferum]